MRICERTNLIDWQMHNIQPIPFVRLSPFPWSTSTCL